MNQKIDTKLGVIIIIIIAITLGAFLWVWEEKKDWKTDENVSMTLPKNKINIKQEQQNQNVNEKNTNSPYEMDIDKTRNEDTNENSNGTISYKSDASTPVLSTEDWNSYMVKKNLIDKSLFEFQYPADWVLDGSVFSDNGNKIAEIAPAGIVILKDNQHCFDGDFKTEYPDLIKLISKNKFKIGVNEGVLRITKVPIASTVWFPNSYCVEENGKALILTFYEKDQNSPNKKMFEKIVSTVNFGN